MPWLFIANEKVVKAQRRGGDEGEAWLLDHEAGSGPFTIKSWQFGEAYEFEAIQDLLGGLEGRRPAAGYIWNIFVSRHRHACRCSTAMCISLSTFQPRTPRPPQGSGLESQRRAGVWRFAVKLNNQRGPFSDVNVRKAVSYAMDYDSIIDGAQRRRGAAGWPVAEHGRLQRFHTRAVSLRHGESQGCAGQSSEYAAGGFEVEYVYVTGLQIEEQIGLILLDKLSQLDITVKLSPLVWPDMVSRA